MTCPNCDVLKKGLETLQAKVDSLQAYADLHPTLDERRANAERKLLVESCRDLQADVDKTKELIVALSCIHILVNKMKKLQSLAELQGVVLDSNFQAALFAGLEIASDKYKALGLDPYLIVVEGSKHVEPKQPR